MHRFFVDSSNIFEAEGYILITQAEDVKHLVKALRVKVGEGIEVSDKVTYEYITEVESMDNQQVKCRIVEKQQSERESNVQIDLYQGIPKSGKMDTIVQKSVELGVYRIVPLKTKRIVSVFKDQKQEVKKVERWQKIADEAAKQSKRGILPEITRPSDLKNLLSAIGTYDAVFVAYEKESQGRFKEELLKFGEGKDLKIAIVVGPEGGFDEGEVDQLVEAGAISVTLGRRILRTETAGVAAMAMVQIVIGDLS